MLSWKTHTLLILPFKGFQWSVHVNVLDLQVYDIGVRIQDFFIFNTTQHNGHIKSTTQFNKGVRNKPTILAKMKISKLTKTSHSPIVQ